MPKAKKEPEQPIDPKSEALLKAVESMRTIANDLEEQLKRRPEAEPKNGTQRGFMAMVKGIESWMDEAATLYNATVDVVTEDMPKRKYMGAFVPLLIERLRLPRGPSILIAPSSTEPRPHWDIGSMLSTSEPERPMRLGDLPSHIVDGGGTPDALVASYSPSQKNWAELGEAVHQAMDWKCARTSELCKWLRESASLLELKALPRIEVGQLEGTRFEVVVSTLAGKIPRLVNFTPVEWIWKLKTHDEINDRYGKKFKNKLGRELPEICPFIKPVTGKRRSGAAAYKSKPYRLDDRMKSRVKFLPAAEKELLRNQPETPQSTPKAQKPAPAAQPQVPDNPAGRYS